jgi:hypothetical protein
MPAVNKPMTETNSRDLFPGALEMMILESLRRGPAHGYARVQHIQQRSNNLLQVEEGSLDPALQRLLKAKLVMSGVGTLLDQSARENLSDHCCGPGPPGTADFGL